MPSYVSKLQPMTFADKILTFHKNLNNNWDLPAGVELLYPFDNKDTWAAMHSFFKKYFDDQRKRTLVFGINPGRFGAGITGTPFTDPKILEEVCNIPNPFPKKNELSAIFVYDFIEGYGGPERFYRDFYITSLCPLGFVKDGKNYNYYDGKDLTAAVEPHIIHNIETNLSFGCNTDVALCLGRGKNYQYFQALNERKQFFKEVVPLPHPRWVMQYRRKRQDEFRKNFVEELKNAVGRN